MNLTASTAQSTAMFRSVREASKCDCSASSFVHSCGRQVSCASCLHRSSPYCTQDVARHDFLSAMHTGQARLQHKGFPASVSICPTTSQVFSRRQGVRCRYGDGSRQQQKNCHELAVGRRHWTACGVSGRVCLQGNNLSYVVSLVSTSRLNSLFAVHRPFIYFFVPKG